mmetsp:Transcript_22973/g.34538  ORF Transcript_22973/g.34538 Transcript_22973/m.34538 type:complete len:212 (-) Transcript_22973:266-901(-)
MPNCPRTSCPLQLLRILMVQQCDEPHCPCTKRSLTSSLQRREAEVRAYHRHKESSLRRQATCPPLLVCQRHLPIPSAAPLSAPPATLLGLRLASQATTTTLSTARSTPPTLRTQTSTPTSTATSTATATLQLLPRQQQQQQQQHQQQGQAFPLAWGLGWVSFEAGQRRRGPVRKSPPPPRQPTHSGSKPLKWPSEKESDCCWHLLGWTKCR